ncbi:MAG: hypothetical protein HZA50_18490 [Planctomycetes bacterium]|nr:hypothetical protein [Planctomycetota bacterium]
MFRTIILVSCEAFIGLGICAGQAPAQSSPATQPTITVNASVKHQTILGWGGTAGGGRNFPEFIRKQLIEALVDDIGLNRLRWEPPAHVWEYPFNDNNDPTVINWNAFKTEETDLSAREWILPFKQQVEARGESFNVYISPSFYIGGSTGAAPDWMMEKPQEYAEWAMAFLTYIKKTYQIEADYYCICNEAGNHNAFSPKVVSAMIKALGPRLKAEGLKTKIEFPECVNADKSWDYITQTKDDSEMWQYVGAVTYHLYGSLKKRPDIRDFAFAKGLPTGQTEFMGTKIHHLFDDLTEGGVSFWEHYVLAGPWGGGGTYITTYPSNGTFTLYPESWNFRQVMRYVRPGAVRVDAIGDNPSVRAVAFVKDGRTTVVLLSAKNHLPGPVTVKGLTAGSYGTCSASGKPYRELGIRQVGPDGTLQVNLDKNSTLTIYPYAGTNLPPAVTQRQADPVFLTLPAFGTTLSATATDPEGDSLSYTWEIRRQPAGAKAALATQIAASTKVSEMTTPGEYVFAVTVGDGKNKTVRELMVPVFEKNQPPQIVGIHNRKPVLIILPCAETELRGATLDLEKDEVALKWSVVKQPEGAQVKLETPDASPCKVTGLSVAGDYVFRLQADDGHNTVSKDLTVIVYPKDCFKWPGIRNP